MWVSVHVYVGLAIAALLREPAWLVAVLAFGSHVPLDLIPHWDYTVSRHPLLWGWVDFLGGLATLIVCLLVLDMPFWMVCMGPLSGAPDFDVLDRDDPGRAGAPVVPEPLGQLPARTLRTARRHHAAGRHPGRRVPP